MLAFTAAAQCAAAGGWYVLTPPIRDVERCVAMDKLTPSDCANEGPDHNAPLGRWHQRSAFDKAADCEKELAEIGSQAEAYLRKSPITAKNAKMVAVQYAIMHGRCVGTDDPRLK